MCTHVYVYLLVCVSAAFYQSAWPSMRLSVYLPLTSTFKLICVLDVAQTRPGAPELDPIHAQALNWITIIGCSLSGVGLLLTLLSASCVR